LRRKAEQYTIDTRLAQAEQAVGRWGSQKKNPASARLSFV